MDESAFYLLPFTGKTYSPRGETPVLNHKLSREHLSVVSGISEEGGMYVQLHDKSINGQGSVEFLRHLLTHISGKILVVWDGAIIHRCEKVKEFLLKESGGRLHLESLPGYSPDLNPAEGVWRYLKCVHLKNICCKGIKELKEVLRKAIRLFRSRKYLIKACFRRVLGN